MLKNKFYLYGNDEVRIPAHLSFGKEAYENMVKNKDVIALINAETGAQMSYGEMAQMTADVALSLVRMGVGKGEVVCLCTDRNFEYLPTVLGVICAGATFSPMDPTYGSCKEFLTETAELEDFLPAPVNGWEDVALILYSSGTTGLPKGVPYTHLGFLSDCQHMVTIESKGVGVYHSGEFYGIYSFKYALACLIGNATIVYNPSGGEKNMLEAVQKYKLRVLLLLPTAAIELATSAILDSYDVSTVEKINSPGSHVPDEALKATQRRFPNPVKMLSQYGMTEAGLISHEQFATKGYRAGSAGKIANGVVVKVVDLETRKPLGPNERGEICMKGYCLTKAYSNNADRDFKDEEGFLKTGDIGYYDEDGYLYIVNRIKELIKFNCICVAPAEFEALLLQHPSVREAAVVGKPHPKHVEVPVAFIVLQPGCTATEEELVQYVNSRVTYKMSLAGGVRFIDRLPRVVINDKVDRKDMLKRLQDEDINSN